MNGTAAGMIVMIAALILNWTSLYVSFPVRRKAGVYAACAILCSPLAFAFSYFVTGVTSPLGLNGLVLLPLCIWLLKGRFFQKTFAVILQMLLTILEHALCGVIVGIFVPAESGTYYLYWLMGTLALYGIHVLLLVKWGQLFYKKLYTFGRETEWALYAFGAAFSLVIMIVMYNVLAEDWQIILMLLFIFWEFSVFCFSIISTHEKAKQRYELELSQGIISAGQAHYRRMDEMYAKLRTLRHDHKYHLNAARKLLHSGHAEEAERYLNGVEEQLSEVGMKRYCANAVINALVAGYAERCEGHGIDFTARLDIPEALAVPDYDMCIILGNLLENAAEACMKLERGRMIRIEAHRKTTTLLLMVQNSFSGVVFEKNGTITSEKANGGFGLRSVREVTDRHGGDLLTSWEDSMFTAYASVRL